MGEGPDFLCPACRQPLALVASGSRRCSVCRRTYPEVAGIPDLRLAGDRYLSLEEDRAKAERLARLGGSFTELVDAYWRMTPEVPAGLARRFAATAADGVRRAGAWLDRLGGPAPGDEVLDVGCGTGPLVVAAAGRGAVVTGVDVALRWLVVARRQCEERGADARLVAADGAVLPFAQGSFDWTFSIEAVEHAADQRGMVQSCLLSVRPGGTVRLVVANRFGMAPDPTFGLWGLGFLPRRAAASYVQRRRRARAVFYRPVSAGELRSMVGLRPDVAVGPAPLPAPPLAAGATRLAAQAAYERARGVGPLRPLLTWLAPYLYVSGRIGESQPRRSLVHSPV